MQNHQYSQLPNHILSFLWRYIKKQPIAFSLIFLTSLVWAFNEAMFAYFIKLIVNTVTKHSDDKQHIFSYLKNILIAFSIVWISMEISMRIQTLARMKAYPEMKAKIRMSVYAYIQQHSYNYFTTHFSGTIANKITDLVNSSEQVLEIFFFSGIAITTALLLSAFLLWQAHPIFGIILLIWFLLHILIQIVYLPRAHQAETKHAQTVTLLSGKIIDALSNIMSICLFAYSKFELLYLKRFQKREIRRARKAIWQLEKMRILHSLIGAAFIITNLILVIYYWKIDKVNLGDFSLVSTLTFNMLGWIWVLGLQMGELLRELGKISSALKLISAPHEIKDKLNAPALIIHEGNINFENVNFHYGHHETIFKNISIQIPAGQKVGLVGFSGSGKTTFVHLILRLYDIDKGRICIDQQNIADVTQASLRRQIAMIPQETILFHRTILENIRYGRIDASDQEVLDAAKQAHCHEFIVQLEDQYYTVVGERGLKLSGGQRQAIMIARAFLKRAPLFILDEATSSLDSVTEKMIQSSLQRLMANRTTIVVAHRLSTLHSMDRILVFHEGKIIEDGTIDELLKHGGHFALLWNLQKDGFLPD